LLGDAGGAQAALAQGLGLCGDRALDNDKGCAVVELAGREVVRLERGRARARRVADRVEPLLRDVEQALDRGKDVLGARLGEGNGDADLEERILRRHAERG
jgi:hypothetical protein